VKRLAALTNCVHQLLFPFWTCEICGQKSGDVWILYKRRAWFISSLPIVRCDRCKSGY
jgi:hypothetical protein